ncbi:MAG: sugar phosphate isomerase/epimerase family protein [Saccharofermentanales bacterium]|jgi:sugar phosphate isomerase/epimerase
MTKLFRYGIACSLNKTGSSAPITFRGDIEDLCERSRKYGYDGIEIHLVNPGDYDWDKISKTKDDYGLSVTALATGREFHQNKLYLLDENPQVRRDAINRLKEHIDVGAKLGALVIVGSMRKDIPDFQRYDYYEGLHNEAVLELAEYAEPKNVTIILENILTFTSNFMNTMRQTADVVRKINKPNVKIHLDTYSMLMEDNDIPGAIQYCMPELEYVHFADSARLYPGGGNVDFPLFLNTLLNVGYKGWIVTECIPWPTEDLSAERGMAYLNALETIVKIKRSTAERDYVQLHHGE